MSYKKTIGLLLLVLVANSQILSPNYWTSEELEGYDQSLISSSFFLYDSVILDYGLTVEARAGAYSDGDDDIRKIYFTAFDGERNVLSQKIYSFIEGDISVCRTDKAEEYFYVYGNENLKIGFINALTGAVTRTDQYTLNTGITQTFSNAQCSFAGNRIYVIATYGTSDWNTVVFVIDLSGNSYTINDLQIINSGNNLTNDFAIQGYKDGSAIAFYQSSQNPDKFYYHTFDTDGVMDQQVEVTNGFYTGINGITQLATAKDLRSELATLLYGNTQKLQIYSYTPSGEVVCFNEISKNYIGQFYKIEFEYIDSTTLLVIGTVSDLRVFFLVDPYECSLKFNSVYTTEFNYGNYYPIISEDQKVKIVFYGADKYTDDVSAVQYSIGSIGSNGCEEFTLFECASCDEESNADYQMTEYGYCESAEQKSNNNNNGGNGNNDDDEQVDSDDANIIKSGLGMIALALISFVLI